MFHRCLKLASMPMAYLGLMTPEGKFESFSNGNFKTIEPGILYFGTPVALISSINDDGSANLAPMSSYWAMGWTLLLGVSLLTQTIENLRRRRDCVVNLPSPELWPNVERLAPLTGRNPVPHGKDSRFHFERDKFAAAALTAIGSEKVAAPRVKECPAQLEAVVRHIHDLHGSERLQSAGGAAAVEVEVVRVHVRGDLVLGANHIDPRGWQPLIYNFRHYFGLGPELGKTFRAEI
jgi:flavin reductase (DIM6/NTAB) family NADH-FMN oxidoreductase RutF